MTTQSMKKHVVNTDGLEWELSEEHGDFSYYDKRLALAAGGEKIGASLYKLMPGKKAFPYHFHHANEEAVYILEGSGTLRLNNEMLPIRSGDYITFPIGPHFAHQIINTSEQPLIFLCFSTMVHPDVSEYPDSNKISVTCGVAPGGDAEKLLLRKRFRKKDEVDYFEGE